MRKKIDRRVPEEQAATVAQVLESIDTMTSGEAARLKGFAASKSRRRGHLPDGRDGDDLLSAALMMVLAGQRRWNSSKVPFTTFLIGAMRSLANHARKASVTDVLQVAQSESDLGTQEVMGTLDTIIAADPYAFGAAPPPNPENQMLQDQEKREACERIAEFENNCGGDWEAQLVMEA